MKSKVEVKDVMAAANEKNPNTLILIPLNQLKTFCRSRLIAKTKQKTLLYKKFNGCIQLLKINLVANTHLYYTPHIEVGLFTLFFAFILLSRLGTHLCFSLVSVLGEGKLLYSFYRKKQANFLRS